MTWPFNCDRLDRDEAEARYLAAMDRRDGIDRKADYAPHDEQDDEQEPEQQEA